jgi:osmoprotectant transport system ATP-binding protein
VIQEIGLFDHMTVGENIATVPELVGWDQSRIDDRVDELLELMDLSSDYRNQYPRELSGGQRQRIGVARALAADPDILLMDEPFGALDPITRENLQDEFLQIQERINTTILFVTHSIDEALKMGDRIAIFDVGEIVQYDTPAEILSNPKNEFVENFIGENQAFKQLSITRVREVMDKPQDHEPASTEVAPAADGGEYYSISPDNSLQLGLTRLLSIEHMTLPVVEDGEVIGYLTEDHVRSYFDSAGEQ